MATADDIIRPKWYEDARWLKDHGYGYYRIARILGRKDHKLVMYWLDDERRVRHNASVRERDKLRPKKRSVQEYVRRKIAKAAREESVATGVSLALVRQHWGAVDKRRRCDRNYGRCW